MSNTFAAVNMVTAVERIEELFEALTWLNDQSYRMEDCAPEGGGNGSHELTVWREGHQYNVERQGAMPMVIVELVKAARELTKASHASYE